MRTASRVFGAIGIFAFAAALLFAAAGHNRAAIQGTIVLALFGLANLYLWQVLGRSGRSELDGLVVPGANSLDDVQHNDPDSLHLPGPSFFPVLYAFAAGLILIGLVTTHVVSFVGIALFVIASIGWGMQAVGEHRYNLGHGAPGQGQDFDRAAVDLAHQVSAFRAHHGGATANVQHLGRGLARIVLVGADGEWGDLVTDDLVAARQACALGGVEAPSTWPAGLGRRMRSDAESWERMGGFSTTHAPGPRDGYTQVGARVFLAIGIFAFSAAALFAASGRSRSSIQGTLILAMFGIANLYLYVFMRNARGGTDDAAYANASGIAAESLDPAPAMDPADIHLPGPSVWPAVFAAAAGCMLIGLITSSVVSLIGVGLFLVAAVGWITQAVGEYRLAQAGGHAGHGGAGDGAVPLDHVTARQTH